MGDWSVATESAFDSVDSSSAVRPANREDLEGLMRLERACYRGVYSEHRWEREQFAYYVRNPSARIAVCQRGAGYCGYVTGVISFRSGGTTAALLSLAVAPAYRKRRVGTALLGWFECECREAKCVSIDLEVARIRRPARRLYERFGYEELGIRKDYYGPGGDAVRMRKTLSR